MNETIEPRCAEFSVSLGAVDYLIEVEPAAEDGSRWMRVKEWRQPTPTYGYWSCVLSERAYDCHNDLEVIREAFRAVHGNLRRWARSLEELRVMAVQETGGKKAYYTRSRNQWAKFGADKAASWKLCKALWREMTRL